MCGAPFWLCRVWLYHDSPGCCHDGDDDGGDTIVITRVAARPCLASLEASKVSKKEMQIVEQKQLPEMAKYTFKEKRSVTATVSGTDGYNNGGSRDIGLGEVGGG